PSAPPNHAETAATPASPPAPEPQLQDLPQVPPSSAAAATTAPDSRIVLRATADSWMQVRERGGQVLLSRVLKAGETWPVPSSEPNLVLTVGNAGGTELVVDGVVAPGIGGSGVVRRDLPLDPDQIKDGRLPAQVQAAAGAQTTPLPPPATRTNPAP
ncbi:MAG: DUF4115 domain-containing protein, partial [Acetobacteraceae bacterium]|nr:DUF4115 domain-containing protein [Acetobacteraceae bacterium]